MILKIRIPVNLAGANKNTPKGGGVFNKIAPGGAEGVGAMAVLRGCWLWHDLFDLLGVGRWLGLAFQEVAGLG